MKVFENYFYNGTCLRVVRTQPWTFLWLCTRVLEVVCECPWLCPHNHTHKRSDN